MVHRRVTQSLGRVWSTKPADKPLGSCVFIAPDEVLTAAHVVAGLDTTHLEVCWVDSNEKSTVRQVVHPFDGDVPGSVPHPQDCAVLQLTMAISAASKLECFRGSLAQGGSLGFAGYSNANKEAGHEFVEATLQHMQDGMFVLNEGSVDGLSGGPAIVDAESNPKLAGVVVCREDSGRPHAWVLPISAIQTLLGNKGTSLGEPPPPEVPPQSDPSSIDLSVDSEARRTARERLVKLLQPPEAAPTRRALAGGIGLSIDVPIESIVDGYLPDDPEWVPRRLEKVGDSLGPSLEVFRKWVCALMPELAVKALQRAVEGVEVDTNAESTARFIGIPNLSDAMSECLVAAACGRVASLIWREDEGDLDSDNRVELKVDALDGATQARAIERGLARRLILDSALPHVPTGHQRRALGALRASDRYYRFIEMGLERDCEARNRNKLARRYLLLRPTNTSRSFAVSLRDGLSKETALDVVRQARVVQAMDALDEGLFGGLGRFFREDSE